MIRAVVQRLVRSSLSRGVIVSYVNTGIGVVSNFVVVPVYLRYLGRQDYGLWMAVQSVVAYLTLLNLGVAQTTANRFGSAVAVGERRRAVSALSTGFWDFAIVVFVAAVALAALVPALPWQRLFKSDLDARHQAGLVLTLSATLFLTRLPLSIFGACLRSIGGIDIEQSISAAHVIVRVAVAVAYLHWGGQLAGVVVVLGTLQILADVAMLVALRTRVPEVSIRPSLRDRSMGRSMRAPSFFYFISQIAGAIGFTTPVLVIAFYLGANDVALYSVVWRLAQTVGGVAGILSSNFGPRFIESYSRGDDEQLGHHFSRALLITCVVGALGAIGLGFVGPAFIKVWVGPENYAGDSTVHFMAGFVLMQAFLLPSDSLIYSTARHKGVAITLVWEAAVNLTLCVLFVQRWGIAGVAAVPIVSRLLGGAPKLLLDTRTMLKGRMRRAIMRTVALLAAPVLLTAALGTMLPRNARTMLQAILFGAGLTAAFGAAFLVGAYLSHRLQQPKARSGGP